MHLYLRGINFACFFFFRFSYWIVEMCGIFIFLILLSASHLYNIR